MRNHTTAKNSAKSSIGVVCSELVIEPQGPLPGGVIKIYSTKNVQYFDTFMGAIFVLTVTEILLSII